MNSFQAAFFAVVCTSPASPAEVYLTDDFGLLLMDDEGAELTDA